MSLLAPPVSRLDASEIGRYLVRPPSGTRPTPVNERLEQLLMPSPTFAGRQPEERKAIPELLFDSLTQFKVWTNSVAMHLDRGVRDGLFRQLDSLLDVESWDADDPQPTLSSFATFIRFFLLLRPNRRPGLAASPAGTIIAMWTSGADRLTVECLPKDMLRWSLSVTVEGENERAAGLTPTSRFADVLVPYRPGRWFDAAVGGEVLAKT